MKKIIFDILFRLAYKNEKYAIESEDDINSDAYRNKKIGVLQSIEALENIPYLEVVSMYEAWKKEEREQKEKKNGYKLRLNL